MNQGGYESEGPMGPGMRYSPRQARHSEQGMPTQRPGALGSQFTPKLASARAIALRGVFGRQLKNKQAGRMNAAMSPGISGPKDGRGQGVSPQTDGAFGTYGRTSMPHRQVLRTSPSRPGARRAEPADGSTPGPVNSR